MTIYGNQTVDGQLDYTLSMNIDRKFFGKDIDNLLKSIPGSDNIKNLDIDAKVEGTLSKPVIKPDLSKAIKAVTKAAEKELKGNLLQGISLKRNKFLLNGNNRVKQHILRLLRCSRFILITNRLFRYYYLIGRSKFSFCRKIR